MLIIKNTVLINQIVVIRVQKQEEKSKLLSQPPFHAQILRIQLPHCRPALSKADATSVLCFMLSSCSHKFGLCSGSLRQAGKLDAYVRHPGSVNSIKSILTVTIGLRRQLRASVVDLSKVT